MEVGDQLQDPATSQVRIIYANCIGENNTNLNNYDAVYSIKYRRSLNCFRKEPINRAGGITAKNSTATSIMACRCAVRE
jgi:hypothetical protein